MVDRRGSHSRGTSTGEVEALEKRVARLREESRKGQRERGEKVEEFNECWRDRRKRSWCAEEQNSLYLEMKRSFLSIILYIVDGVLKDPFLGNGLDLALLMISMKTSVFS